MALSRIDLYTGAQQHQADGMLKYLSKYGQHIERVDICGSHTVQLSYLPANLQLSSLRLYEVSMHSSCVVGLAASLNELELCTCTLLDGAEGLTAALALMPGLQHLRVVDLKHTQGIKLATQVLPGLQQLTYLALSGVELEGHDQEVPALQPLQALTQLKDLRLVFRMTSTLTSSILSGMQQLTRLRYYCGSDSSDDFAELGPGAISALTKLQHLQLYEVCLPGTAQGLGLLSQVQVLTQLTHLDLEGSNHVQQAEEGNHAAAACSALTASSKLQYLCIRECTIPAAAWQHMFPAGRQLLQLSALQISRVKQPNGSWASAPPGNRLVACCPGLQKLNALKLQYTTELLAPLHKLSALRDLSLSSASMGRELTAVGDITRLKVLLLEAANPAEALLLQLPRLKQLTTLVFNLFMPDQVGLHKVWRPASQQLVCMHAAQHGGCHRHVHGAEVCDLFVGTSRLGRTAAEVTCSWHLTTTGRAALAGLTCACIQHKQHPRPAMSVLLLTGGFHATHHGTLLLLLLLYRTMMSAESRLWCRALWCR
jgi:hypothetical protein